MSKPPRVGVEDTRRFLTEQLMSLGEGMDDWCEKAAVEPEVIAYVIEQVTAAMVTASQQGVFEDAEDAFGASVMAAFVLGWDLRGQFRPPR